ncbi:hypothetical protein SCYAM73S_07435 [Streptomyces cyaneofuscatus]
MSSRAAITLARVVDDDVQPPEGLDGLADDALGGVGVGNVEPGK